MFLSFQMSRSVTSSINSVFPIMQPVSVYKPIPNTFENATYTQNSTPFIYNQANKLQHPAMIMQFVVFVFFFLLFLSVAFGAAYVMMLTGWFIHSLLN